MLRAGTRPDKYPAPNIFKGKGQGFGRRDVGKKRGEGTKIVGCRRMAFSQIPEGCGRPLSEILVGGGRQD